MTELNKALRNSFKNLTKEELIELACILMNENLHRTGPKKKIKEA